MTTPPRQPPRLALWALGRLLPRSLREPVLGDLAERYDARAAIDPAAARRGFWAEWWDLARGLSALSNEPTTLTPPRPPMQGLTGDLRFALRVFGRRPGYTFLALLTLAVGIGATTAIFSIVKPALLDQLPYPTANRLVLVWQEDRDGNASNVGFPTFIDFRDQSKALVGAAAMGFWSPTLLGAGESLRLRGQKVSASFFRLLGVAPALGRDFTPDDDRPGVERVVIVSHRLWRDRLGADPAALDRSISLDGNPARVVGVLPPEFESLLSPDAEIWVPLRYDLTLPYACRTCQHLRMLGLLAPGVGREGAAAELATVSRRLKATFPTEYEAEGVQVEALKTNLTKAARPTLLTLFAAVALVLILACVNVANLALGQAVERQHEFGVRMALGSGRGRLVRQVLLESTALGLAGAALAVAVAAGALAVLRQSAASQLPRGSQVGLDWQVLAFAAILGVIAGVTFGLLPALVSLESAGASLRQSGRISRRRGARRALIVAEVTAASILVVGTGLLVKSMGRLLEVDPGFEPDRLLTAEVQVAGARFGSDTASWRYFDQVKAAVAAVPGITAVDLVNHLPLGGDFDAFGIQIESKPLANPADAPAADRFAVTAGFFHTMGIPVLEGRAFTAADRLGAAPVAVIGETMARTQFPGKSAVGERIQAGGPEAPWRTIVGVVGDVRHHGLDRPQTLQFYTPHDQWMWSDGFMVVVARTAGKPEALGAEVAQAIRRLDADPTIENVRPMAAVISHSTTQRRLLLRLFEAFAGLALLLAGVGIYGVMSSGVAERLKEFGIRSALGAPAPRLVRQVVGEAVGLGAVGIGLGLAACLALGPFVRALLFEVRPIDPVIYLGAAFLLAGIATIAAWGPAWRAARYDPVEALRAD